MSEKFSNSLIEKVTQYFKIRHNKTLTESEAQEVLQSLSDLYGLFSDTLSSNRFFDQPPHPPVGRLGGKTDSTTQGEDEVNKTLYEEK